MLPMLCHSAFSAYASFLTPLVFLRLAMNATNDPSKPRLVLPEGVTEAVLLSGLPSALAAQLRKTCVFEHETSATIDPRITTALDGLGEGVAVVVDRGEIVWMNDRLADHSAEMLRLFSDRCAEAITEFEEHPDVRDGEIIRLGFDFNKRSYEVICSPMPRDPERHKVSALLCEVTELRETERLVEHLDSAGAELLNLDPGLLNTLDLGARLRLLETRVVATLRDSIGFEHFEVRLVDRESGQLELVMSSGAIEDLPIGERMYASETENGISGWVAARAEPYICSNTDRDPLFTNGIRDAKSSLTVPLMLRDCVAGVLNVESTVSNAFDERDLLVLEIYSRYIAMAINILDMLVVERYTTSTALSTTIMGELTSPLESIDTRIKALRESASGVPAMTNELDAIQDAVRQVRDRVSACTTGPQTILGAGEADGDPIEDALVSGRRILVADDEPAIRDTIGAVLMRRGAAVTTHADGVQAINAVQTAMDAGKPYDLIVSDVRMPGCNGYEVFRAAKTACDDTRVILMTGFGYDPHHSIVRSSQEGLEAFLFKPFQVEQLLEEVHKALSPA